MEAWLIAVIVVGSIVGLVLLLLLLLCLLSMYMKGPTKGSDNPKRLDGKVVVITGGNGGIGKATAEDLYKRGAKVIMLCRNVEKAQEAVEDIVSGGRRKGKDDNKDAGRGGEGGSGRDKGTLEVRKLDLSSLASVKECAKELGEAEDRINILINNAGIAMAPEGKTEDGFDKTFGTNHLGHFLLTELLTPLLKNAAVRDPSARPRVVIVSSMIHRDGRIQWDDLHYDENPKFEPWQRYCDSKLANLMHSKELARRVEPYKVNVYAVHPGVVSTELMRQLEERWYGCLLMPIARRVLRTPYGGAQTSLYCALEDKLESQTGGYYADCREVTPDRRALNEEEQKRLWRLSVRAVGLPTSSE